MGHVSVASSEVFTAAEIARAAGVSVRAVRELIRGGSIDAMPGGFVASDEAASAVKLLSGSSATESSVRRQLFAPPPTYGDTHWRAARGVDGRAWRDVSDHPAGGHTGRHEPGRFTAVRIQTRSNGVSRDPRTRWRRWRWRPPSASTCAQGTTAGNQSHAQSSPGVSRHQERNAKTRASQRAAACATC